MKLKDIVLHLRFPFSYLLLPVFLLAILFVPIKMIDTEKVDYRRCICSSAKCQMLCRQVLQIVNRDHAWGKNNGFTEIRHQKDSFSFHVEGLRRIT